MFKKSKVLAYLLSVTLVLHSLTTIGFALGDSNLPASPSSSMKNSDAENITITPPSIPEKSVYTTQSSDYTVNFAVNDGYPKPDIQLVADGEKVDKPEDPARDEYAFEGWYSDPEYTYKWGFNGDTVASDITLYAKWVSDSIFIDDEIFPDGVFQDYIRAKFDLDKDGFLSTSERYKATSISITFTDLSDFTGLEYFPKLKYLTCFNNQLYELDLSKNEGLVSVHCANNRLSALDTSRNPQLEVLRCYSNQLSNLVLIKNTKLADLDCSYNDIASLDISKNTELTELRCEFNLLSNLDLTNNTKLVYLSNSSNELTALDISKNTALQTLYCAENRLGTLTLEKNPELKYLNCADNLLTTLSLLQNGKLATLNCSYNQLNTIDLTGNRVLKSLDCTYNELTSLNVDKNIVLQVLNCSYNQLSELNLSENSALTGLSCSDNALKELNVHYAPKLTYLICSDNELAYLDVSGNPSLISFDCSYNHLTSMNVSNNPHLTYFEAMDQTAEAILKRHGGKWTVNIGNLVGTKNYDRVETKGDAVYDSLTGLAILPSSSYSDMTYHYDPKYIDDQDYKMNVLLTLTVDTSDNDYGNIFEDAFEWELEIGENTLNGSLEVSEDVDMFKFTASVTGVYTIYSSDCTGDVYGHLYDSNEKELTRNDDGAGNGNFKIERGLVAGETYYVKIRNYSSTAAITGSYKLHVVVPAISDDYGNTFDEAYEWRIEIGENTLDGNLEIAADEDMFQFTALTTGIYTIHSSNCTGDVYGHLYDSNEKELSRNDDGGEGRNFKIERQLEKGQVYYVKIHNYTPTASVSGAYIMNILVPDETDDYGDNFEDAYVWDITAGENMLEGILEVSADEDMFKFTAPFTGTYTICSSNCTGDIYGILYDSNEKELAADDDSGGNRNFKIEQTLEAGQIYYAKIRNYKSTTAITGAYQMYIIAPAG